MNDQAKSTLWTFDRLGHRHTPSKDGMGYVSDADGRDILHVGHRDLTEAENVAIGNLAAAAPEMLAALKKIRAAFDALRPFPLVIEPIAAALVAEADQTIARAEGRKS